MSEIREKLFLAIYDAEFRCIAEHGCRDGADCVKCELFERDCMKGYIADRLLEQFDINQKNGGDE